MALEGLMIDLEVRSKKLGEKTAKSVLREIRRILVPGYGYDTGLLRKSYIVLPTPVGWSIVQTAQERVEPPIWYYVEFGTRRMHARPHVRPAIETVRARQR